MPRPERSNNLVPSTASICLSEVRTEWLLGFAFINLDAAAPPLATQAPGLANDIRAHLPMYDELVARGERNFVPPETRANWKVVVDNFLECYHCRTAHPTFSEMAEQTRTSGRSGRAKAIREAIGELDQLVHGTAVSMAAQADEFSGAALGAQHVRIDPHIDTDMLRRWLDEQWVRADEKLTQTAAATDSAEGMLAAQRAGWEKLYCDQMPQSLDKGVSPLATSSEMIAYVRSNASKAQFELLLKLEAGLVATLSDPAFIRSISEMAEIGADTFPPMVRARIDAGLAFLGPDSLRLAVDNAIPPPLHPANLSDLASHVGEVRDRSFSRSSLAANEETLERHVLDAAETDPAPRRGTPSARAGTDGFGTAEHAGGIYRSPPDNAQAPVIDEPSGVSVIEPLAESDPSLAHRDGLSLPAQGDGASARIPPVSWDSGLQESDDW